MLVRGSIAVVTALWMSFQCSAAAPVQVALDPGSFQAYAFEASDMSGIVGFAGTEFYGQGGEINDFYPSYILAGATTNGGLDDPQGITVLCYATAENSTGEFDAPRLYFRANPSDVGEFYYYVEFVVSLIGNGLGEYYPIDLGAVGEGNYQLSMIEGDLIGETMTAGRYGMKIYGGAEVYLRILPTPAGFSVLPVIGIVAAQRRR